MLRKKIDRLLEIALVFLFGLMLVNVVWQVLSRYLLQSPSTLTEELSSYSLIWAGMLGAAYASGKNLHLAIDILPQKLNKSQKAQLNQLIQLSIALFAALVMVYGGLRLSYLTLLLEQKSATLEIPLGYVYAIVPLSGLLIIFYALDSLLNNQTIGR